MITYEEAKAKALKIDPEVDSALEYQQAYVFYKAADYQKKITEDNMEIVLLKSNGDQTTLFSYFLSVDDEEKPKKLEF